MFKRLLLILAFTMLPLAALADDASPEASQPAPTPAEASSNGLGPNSVIPAAGSPTDSGASLQPAGLAPLQSTTGDSTGLSAPQSALQAPATGNDTLKVLAGEADGSPHSPADAKPVSPWPFVGVGLLALVVVTSVMLTRERRQPNAPDQGDTDL